jgi:hypothetical protein
MAGFPLTVNCRLDLHRQQITLDWVDNECGECAGAAVSIAARFTTVLGHGRGWRGSGRVHCGGRAVTVRF